MPALLHRLSSSWASQPVLARRVSARVFAALRNPEAAPDSLENEGHGHVL
jgi:hypothetical protein